MIMIFASPRYEILERKNTYTCNSTALVKKDTLPNLTTRVTKNRAIIKKENLQSQLEKSF